MSEMDLLTQALRDAADEGRIPLRPPGQARRHAERARARRRAAAGTATGLALAAVTAVVLTAPPLTRGAPPAPARTATTATVTLTSTVTTSASTTTTSPPGPTTTTTTSEPPSGPAASGALEWVSSAPEDYLQEPWTNENVKFGLLNLDEDGLYCIAPATFLYGDSLTEYRRSQTQPPDSDYEIVYGTVPPSCYEVNDSTQIYGRRLMNPGGDGARAVALSKKAFVRAFDGREKKNGDALWPVWYAVDGDGTAGNPLGYLAEQYDPDDLRLSGS